MLTFNNESLIISIRSGFLLIAIYLGKISRKTGQLAKRLPAECRIGPHNKDILSIFTGTLLGDAHAEQRQSGKGTRISIFQEAIHKEYLLYLHKLIADLGYCNPTPPAIQTRLGVGSKLRYIIRFHTYTYSSLNEFHAM